MTDTATITLGGKPFKVAPFTFAQLRVIVPGFTLTGGRLLTSESWEHAATVLVSALSASHPEITRESLDEMQIQVPEVFAALNVIAEVSGLVPKGEAKAGTESL